MSVKTLITFLLLAGVFLFSRERPLFLRINWHPENEALLKQYTEVHWRAGRVELRRLKGGIGEAPAALKTILRPVDEEEVRVYRPSPMVELPAQKKIVDWLHTARRETFVAAVGRLTQFENRGVSDLRRHEGAGNALARKWIFKKLQSYGWNPSFHCYREIGPEKECNVLAENVGENSEEVILILAHLDDVGHSRAGADDNASGTAALLTMAESLATQRFRRTVRILFTNGEESGFVGSRAYVRHLKSSGELERIQFTINMDMVAYNRNSIFEIETDREFEEQAKWYAALARTYTELTPEITIPAWGSDHEVFLNEGIPSVLTIEDWQTKTPCYHRSCDKVETLNIDYAMEIVRLNLAATAELAGLAN